MAEARTGSGLALEAIEISAGGRRLVSLREESVPPGAALAVMGPSGSGKSSLLAFVCGTLGEGFAATGRVRLDGTLVSRLPAHRRRIGILFQDDLLFPHLSVGQNLAFGLAPEIPRRQRQAEVAAALARIELEGYGGRDPATLSGGQRARVALMRMLLSRPRALLLDEPFRALDPDLGVRMRAMLAEEAARRGLPVVIATHDEADAHALGARILRIGGTD